MKQFYDAFISYGREDSKAFAIKLHEKLTAQGLNIWFDQEDIPLAVDFQEQINSGIEKAHNFIFIIAPHSVNSEYCRQEINQAIKYNKRIIPYFMLRKLVRKLGSQEKRIGLKMTGKNTNHRDGILFILICIQQLEK